MTDPFWEKQQMSIPFKDGLPKEFQVHDELITCPECKGELFGRCLCCQLYFCHGLCDAGIYNEDEIIEMCSEDEE